MAGSGSGSWRRGQAYSQHLRDRVLGRPELTARQAAERFGVSVSYVVKARARRRGVLLASGLIVGESLMGVLLAGIIGATGNQAPLSVVGADFEATAAWLGLAAFLLVCAGFYGRVTARR